jgi:hypothetical protein
MATKFRNGFGGEHGRGTATPLPGAARFMKCSKIWPKIDLDFAHCSAREAKVGFRKSALNPTLRFEALV